MSTIFDEMIAEMESNNLALEALLADMSNDEDQMDPATEGLFSKPKTLDEMLANVKKTVDKKCKTSEDCEDWLAKVKGEEEKFNEAIKALKEATKKYQSDNDQKALKAACKPILKNLKKTCNILSMKDISADAGNITEEELKKLRDFLVGAKKIINDKAAECDKGDCDHTDGESAEESGSGCESFLAMLQNDDVAMESAVGDGVKKLGTTIANAFKAFGNKAVSLAKKAPKAIGSKLAAIGKWFLNAAKTAANFVKNAPANALQALKNLKASGDKKKQEMDDLTKDQSDWGDGADGAWESALDVEIMDAEYAMESALADIEAIVDVATEADIEGYTIEDFMSFAMEGIISPDQKQAWNIKGGEIAKQLKSTISEAKKAAKSKDYTQSLALYNKALKGYRGLLATAKKIPDKQLGTNMMENGVKYADGSDTYKGLAKSKAIAWCNKKISECQAAIQKVKDKQTKSGTKASESAIDDAFTDFESTLESLMADESEPEESPEEDPLEGLDEALSEE